jgi:hypothetical protein
VAHCHWLIPIRERKRIEAVGFRSNGEIQSPHLGFQRGSLEKELTAALRSGEGRLRGFGRSLRRWSCVRDSSRRGEDPGVEDAFAGFLKQLLGVAGEASSIGRFGHGRTVRPGAPESKWRGPGDAHRRGGSSSTKGDGGGPPPC